MKKILVMVLCLAVVLSLAACGQSKQAEVVDNVDPENNNIVIETPPAIVSGTEPTPEYPAVSVLPTTVPTTVPSVVPTVVPSPSTAPSDNTGTGTGGNGGTTGGNGGNTDTGRNSQSYRATISQKEIDNGKTYYVTGDGVNFREGPGTQYKIIESLEKGTKVTVVGNEGGWAKVWYNDYVGYMSANYLSTTAPDGSEEAVVVSDTPAPSTDPVPTTVPTEAPPPDVIVIEP